MGLLVPTVGQEPRSVSGSLAVQKPAVYVRGRATCQCLQARAGKNYSSFLPPSVAVDHGTGSTKPRARAAELQSSS